MGKYFKFAFILEHNEVKSTLTRAVCNWHSYLEGMFWRTGLSLSHKDRVQASDRNVNTDTLHLGG